MGRGEAEHHRQPNAIGGGKSSVAHGADGSAWAVAARHGDNSNGIYRVRTTHLYAVI